MAEPGCWLEKEDWQEELEYQSGFLTAVSRHSVWFSAVISVVLAMKTRNMTQKRRPNSKASLHCFYHPKV